MSLQKQAESSERERGVSLPLDPQSAVVPPISDMHERNWDLFNLVFGIDMLRDKIVDFVIHEEGELSRENAYSCRLVQRSWNESVTKSLTTSGESLFQLHLLASVDLIPTSLERQFLDEYASSSRLFSCVPPFSLCITFDVETPERVKELQKLLQKCLRWCGSGLLSFSLSFCCGMPLPELPAGLSLPVLQRLNLYYFGGDDDDTTSGKYTAMVQLILSACRNLAILQLEGYQRIPLNFGTMCFPPTLTKLELPPGTTFDNLDQLAICAENEFPNLTHLTVTIPVASYDGKDAIYRILDGVRLTLKTLNMKEGIYCTRDWTMTPIHFPVMKSLQSCTIHASNWTWAKDGFHSLERNLPIVKELHLDSVSTTNLLELVETSRLEGTERLVVHLRNEGSNVNEDLTQALAVLPRAFPNVSTLGLSCTIVTEAPNIFQHIFQNMPQLKELSISLNAEEVIDPDQFWVLMFLGMLPEEITATTFPSIANLSELRYLKLDLLNYMNYHDIILPDAVLEYGFLKMPMLLDLLLTGNFTASMEMKNRWVLSGRRDIYVEHEELAALS